MTALTVNVLAHQAYKAARAVKKTMVKRKSALPVLNHILLYERHGQLAMSISTLDESYTAYAQALWSCPDWAICVPARTFTDYLRTCEKDLLKLEFLPETMQLVIHNMSFPSCATINGLSVDEFPPIRTHDGSHHELEL